MRLLILILSLLCINTFAKLSPEKIAYVEEIKQRAAKGDADAQNKLGSAYFNSDGLPKDPAEAVKWWKKSAEQGNAAAQCNLGMAYYWGDGVTKNKELAKMWYQKSADQGDSRGQYGLGTCYLYSDEGNNRLDAINWYLKSANKDYAPAQYALGELYTNEVEAAKWYLKAAQQGEASAQYKIGLAYMSGKGVPKDIVDSYAYLYLAAETNREAQFALRNLEAQISLRDKKDGLKRVLELQDEIEKNIDVIKDRRGW
jgi:hypothetical protein